MSSIAVEEAHRLTTEEERERSFLVTDPRQKDNPIVFANNAFLRLTGYARDEVIGHNCRLLQGPDTNPESVRALREAIAAARPIEIDILNYTKAGAPFWNRLRIRPAFDGAGALRSFIGVQIQILESEVDETPRGF